MPTPEPDSDRIRSIVARCVEAAEQGTPDPAAALCAETPELADAVRRRLERLQRLGLLGQPEQQLESFGCYEVKRQLGAGGMGAVYLAEQRDAVRRQVALKVIKLGMDSAAVLRRFELERQALASMDHDAIAKIYDAGVTDRGQPYFSMEYVDGTPITEHCDRYGLSVRERIELFQEVCAGVQHAHQKGVVHRDLKPSNVLVKVHSDRAKPKIIDFGLARAVDRDNMRQTLFTELGQVVGTPEYMAPEQAEPGSPGVDTRSDVYSLGVLLHEMLTGTLPPKDHSSDTRRPSTRTTSPATRRALRGDLDWIVLKAMALDPDKRYASAAELAQDLQRHLDGDPVAARPPSARYRLRKLLGRHRVAFAVTLSILVTSVAAAVGMAIAFTRASRDAENARANLGIAVTAIDTLLVRNAEERLRGVPNSNPIVLASLRDALALYERLLERAPDDFDLLLKQAGAELRLGAVLLGWHGPGSTEGREALAAARESLLLLRERRPDEALIVRYLGDFALAAANVLVADGRADEALEGLRQAIAELAALGEDSRDPTWYWKLIGDLQSERALRALQTGNPRAALEAGRESLACRRRLVALAPGEDAFRTELARALNRMVMIHGRSGTAEAALGYAAEACDLVDELAQRHGSDEYYRQDQATAWYMYAALERQLRHHEEAEQSARRAIGLYEALAADHADKLLYRYGLGLSRLTLAQALLAQDESAEAVPLLRSGLDISAELRAASPQDGRYVELRRWLLHELVAALPASAAEVPELQRELEALASGGR